MKKNEYMIRSPLCVSIRCLRFGMLMAFTFLSWGAYAQTPTPAVPFDEQNNITEPVELEWTNSPEYVNMEIYEAPLRNGDLDLENYKLICEGQVTIPVESALNSAGAIKYNLSGITYNSETETLFMVTDAPTKVYETGLDGTILRVIDLVGGFEDTEAIVHIEGTRFAVTEERKANIVFFDIDAATTQVSYSDQRITITNAANNDNDGLEGLAYNPLNNTIHTVKEKKDGVDINGNDIRPRAYYTFPIPETLPTDLTQGTQCPFWNTAAGGGDDYAGLHHLGATTSLHYLNIRNDFLVLGENGSRLLQIDNECQEISRRNFSVNRLEGVTMDDNGRLYIVSENDDETADNISKLYIYEYTFPGSPVFFDVTQVSYENTLTIPTGTLESGKRYAWRVQNFSDFNTCKWSSFSYFTMGGGCPENLVITDADVPNQYIEASNSIVTRGMVTVDNQEELTLDAGAYVELFPGFTRK